MVLKEGIQLGVRHGADEHTALDVIRVENDFCHAEIALQGAQILQYQQKPSADHQAYPPLLWLSEHNSFAPTKAIRGGIPLCFPWFGAHAQQADYPAHGFARNLPWRLSTTDYDAVLGHLIVFELSDCDATRQFWDYVFTVQMHIRCGRELSLELHVFNRDEQPFEFNFAWHSYFAVSDIARVQILGLQNTEFMDKLADQQQVCVEDAPITIHQEMDRTYPCAAGHYHIYDHASCINIEAPLCPSAVVWNPWIEKTKRLGDMSPDAWQRFVCVECGQIGVPVNLEAGQQTSFAMLLQSNFYQ